MMQLIRRPGGEPHRMGFIVGAFALALVLGALMAPDRAAAANPTVLFLSDHDDGFDHGVVTLFPGTTVLKLYAYAGLNSYRNIPGSPSSLGSDICRPQMLVAEGDEMCGIDARIEVSGDAVISAFDANGDVPEMVASGIPPGGTTKLRLVFLRATDPPLPAGGPHMLGTLTLVRGAGAAAVSITGVNALGADFATQAIVPKLIAVPEPGPWLLLTSGLLGLAGLGRWRRRD